jgi:hypothetical protein
VGNQHREHYRDLADRATNDEVLLPNEDFGTTYVEDADHWIAVFSELLAFKVRLIGTAEDVAGAMQDAGREEVEHTDLVLLNAERKRFEDHLARWRQRRAELAGG